MVPVVSLSRFVGIEGPALLGKLYSMYELKIYVPTLMGIFIAVTLATIPLSSPLNFTFSIPVEVVDHYIRRHLELQIPLSLNIVSALVSQLL